MTSNEQKPHAQNTQGVIRPSNRDVNAANRASLAMKLRASKLSYEQIAKQCGYANRGACHNAVQRELDRSITPDRDELRREEGFMLNQMHTECWKLFMDKNNIHRLFAADRILAISERYCKLMGLDVKPDENMNANITLVRETPHGYIAPVVAKEVIP